MSDVFRTAPDTSPDVPRPITPDIERDADVHGRFLRLFGQIWTFIGVALSLGFSAITLAAPHGFWLGPAVTSLFWIFGASLWAIGARQRRSALEVFRTGVEVQGEVVDVYRDLRVRLNGQNPWRVVYEFMAGSKLERGTATFWDVARPRVEKGERVAVLHAPGRPSKSVLWTRIETNPEEPTKAEANVRISIPTAAKPEPESEPESESESEPKRARLESD